MASTYGNDLRLEEIGDGEQSGTWGATTNTNLELIAEALSFGTEAITTNADTHTTTIADGATDPGRSLYLKYTGTLDSTCTITIAPNSISKTWYIENGTSGSQSIIISQGSGANVTIPTGQTKIVYSDGAGSGAAMAEIGTLGVTNLAVTTNATVGGTLGVTGVLTGTSLDISGNVDVDGTLETDALSINSTAVTSTAAELNILDGVTATTAELNIMDGVTATTAELNIMDGVTSTTAELNILDGVTSTATEINQLDAITRGSILYGNASGATARLAKGAADTVLTSDGTDISWAAAGATAGALSKTATGAVAIRKGVQIRPDGNAEQVKLAAAGVVPVKLSGPTTYTTSSTGYSYWAIAVNPSFTEFVHALQAASGKIVACTINADGTVTTSSESSWAADPATNSNYQYGGTATADRAYVIGLYGNNGQAYVRGAYTTGNAGSVVVNSANTVAIDGGNAAGNWEIGSFEEGYFFVVKFEDSNAYIKFGSQDASNGQISLASSWTTIASNYSTKNIGVGVDYHTKKVVVLTTSNANTNADIYCTTIQRGSGTASGTKSATVDAGWNSSNYGGIGFIALTQDGTSKKMIYANQYGKEGQGGATNNTTYGTKGWFTIIDTSGTDPVWQNKSGNNLYDFPKEGDPNINGTSRPYGSNTTGARIITSSGTIVTITTDGTESGTSLVENSFNVGGVSHMALYKQDGSAVAVNDGYGGSTSGTVVPFGFANLGATIGISSNAVSNGGTVNITTVGGLSTGHSGLSPGSRYYANPTDGAITSAQGTDDQQSVGLAVSSTEILIGVE